MDQTNKFSLVTKRLVIGHVTVCQGWCCGNIANGRPPVPVDWLEKEWRARGLLKRAQLTISGCLGPCDLPNVVTISDDSGTQWLGGITEFDQYLAIVDWRSSFSERHKTKIAIELTPLRFIGYFFSRIDGVNVSPTSSPSESRNRLTVWRPMVPSCS
jgi:hypothetical protein